MRGGRSLLVLLVLGLGLGAYIYFVESKRDLTDPAEKKEKVFSVEAGKIEEIRLTGTSGDVTTLKKSGTDWQIVAPIAVAADQAAVESLIASLETVEMQKTLEENPKSVSAFGLEPARLSVAFKASGDSALRSLQIGNKTPVGTDLYARVEGQPKLFLISASLDSTFDRSTFDMRDKTVLKFPRGDVDAVALGPARAPALTLARTDNTWRLTSPVAARADWTPVDTLINRVANTRMMALVPTTGTEPTPAELKKFGLDAPQVAATFGAGSTKATLALGAKKDDGSVYARDLSRPIIFTVEASLVDELKKGPDDLRVKDVFEFKPYSIQNLSVTRGPTTESFAKTSTPAKDAAPATDVWKQTQPQAKDVNQTAMADLLNTFSTIRATSFAARALASGEDIVISAKFGETTPVEERVTFRRSGGVVHALRTDEPGAAVVSTVDFDKALTQLKDLSSSK